MSDACPRLPVSVIVLTHNEENNIEGCLQSVAGWAGEILVVDSGSTDATLDIVRRFTDAVSEHPFDNYSLQRNWAQENLPLRYHWVLHIDADERVSPELAVSIASFFRSGSADGVNGAMFSRRTVFMGRWIRHGGHYPVFHTRLYRRDKGGCEDRLYDQHFIVRGPVVRLRGDLIDVLTSDLDVWSTRHLRWAAAEAREMRRAPADRGEQVTASLAGGPIARRRWLRSGLFARSPLFTRVLLYFLYRYVIRLGFLDGTQGLIFHFLHGCWYRFYVDANIWQLERHSKAHDTQTHHTLEGVS